MIRALVLALAIAAAAPAQAQFATNVQRDQYIAALAKKVNAQTAYIKAADLVIRDLRCALDKLVEAHAAVLAGMQAVPPIPVPVHVLDTKCGTAADPVPQLAPLP